MAGQRPDSEPGLWRISTPSPGPGCVPDPAPKTSAVAPVRCQRPGESRRRPRRVTPSSGSSEADTACRMRTSSGDDRACARDAPAILHFIQRRRPRAALRTLILICPPMDVTGGRIGAGAFELQPRQIRERGLSRCPLMSPCFGCWFSFSAAAVARAIDPPGSSRRGDPVHRR